MQKLLVFLVPVLAAVCGCATGQKNMVKSDQGDAVAAVGAVAGTLSGKAVNEKDLRNMAGQIAKDKDARTAVEKITDSFDGKKNMIKYCPVDGKRFDAGFTKCPEHGVELEILKP